MKQVRIMGPRLAGVESVDKPRPRDNWALIKVLAAPLCTEYKTFAAGGDAPLLGHEAAGIVVDIAQPSRVAVGDRVVAMPMNCCGKCALCLGGEYIHCQDTLDFAALHGSLAGAGTMAQYLLKQDWMLLPIPDEISIGHAAMACCGLGPSFGALQAMRVDRHDTLLITGLGPVGLGGVINAVYRGARVIGVEANRYRQRLALELGAAAIVDPRDPDALAQVRALTHDGRGVDKAIDCSGVVTAHRLCIDAARRKGIVAFVGECGDDTPLRISDDMIRKGLRLLGSWHYNLADAPRLLRMIGDVGAQLDKLITHRFGIMDIQSAWETQLSGQCGKVILRPWEADDV
ncbi:MAG: zinc-binding dehydrogenase [Chloroflexi bacterium]|nr:zinc-binding dehydrogenase [Chloroflexota bacterium]MCY3582389.1 zinc-binding dehydrogenase [Chloroflexota bacterium]MCY3717099.1 zinc-binding dehydrogenase [Chloroflexota bacterium]MDE2650803.1 zinc-binding dehydrogenase [Chloroflexota bacterium]MXX49737.1 zinc-binding dehydrogenase [Chloroflexota bacterium]